MVVARTGIEPATRGFSHIKFLHMPKIDLFIEQLQGSHVVDLDKVLFSMGE
jgi:hypothetical protein